MIRPRRMGDHMKKTLSLTVLLLSILTFLLSACATTLVPGAEKVKVTNTPADVAACKILGEIEGHVVDNIWGSLPQRYVDEMRNRTVLAGGNTLLITSHSPYSHARGMAYQCPESGVGQR
jgi:hypothetical protein